ncbi:hypothetical protein [Commensalibacter oyaizuii]|uniref:Uncharacterized protein n=1 Tax=Commensalibacter oyaizuii TaxID=3043873 RepID=A0ABT6Q3U7_9PROT|nr:hypothetical protein [Commensalibacter sp. TBRC 16381]MDI2091690.1 hypothetical protein [Commensalibacter sp. TBRC 16381]
MKKILLILAVITISTQARAETFQKQIPQERVQAAIDLIANATCKKNLREGPRAVYECYKNTDKNSPQFEVCMLADMSTSNSARIYQERHDALGDPNPYEGIPFVDNKTFVRRMAVYLFLPRFHRMERQGIDVGDYFGSSIDKVTDGINAKCKAMEP